MDYCCFCTVLILHIFDTLFFIFHVTQKFDVLITWGRLGSVFLISSCFVSPNSFSYLLNLVSFVMFKHVYFLTIEIQDFTSKRKAKHEGYYLQIGCWTLNVKHLPCLHFFRIVLFDWVQHKNAMFIYLLGHEGVLNLFQEVLLLTAVQTQTVVLEKEIQCKLINAVTVS